jgi:hypothetical protein
MLWHAKNCGILITDVLSASRAIARFIVNMKDVHDVVACCIDYGTFISVADRLGQEMKKVYYYSPYETEYQTIRDCVQGTGLGTVERLDDIFDPDIFDTIDLFVFPDIGFGSLQRHIRSLGKAVWGHMGADELELYRDYFIEVLKKVGLPTIHTEKIVGLSALADYLKEHDNVWVKCDRFRGNMETWKSKNYRESIRTLDSLAVIFGGAKELVTFMVQDHIKTKMEAGYDGWCIDGQFPPESFQGYEKKNELYLGSALKWDDLPEEIRTVNEAMAPVLKSYGYRCWWATEIRIGEDDKPYFIDPTPRMPGQTGEHQLETCENLSEVIWAGANGIIVPPKFTWKFAAEATIHWQSNTKDSAISEEWKTADFPPEVRRWLKLYHYCILPNGESGDDYNFVAEDTDEIGVVLGVGDDTEEAIQHLKENFAKLKDLPVHIEDAGFVELIDSIKEAEKHGMPFGGKLPKPEAVLKEMR